MSVTSYTADCFSKIVFTYIVQCGLCGNYWESGHICHSNSSTTDVAPFCCVCGLYHTGAGCTSEGFIATKGEK